MAFSARGQTILDMIFVLVGLLLVAIVSVLAYKMLSDINIDVQADGDIAAVGKSELSAVTTNYPLYMDNAFVLLFVMLWVALIVTSFLVDSHPVFFILTVVLLVFVFVVSMILSNVYQDVMADADFSTAASFFPKATWIWEHILEMIITMGFTAAIALYAKAQL